MAKITPPIQFDVVEFSLTIEQVERLNQWIAGVHLRAAELQSQLPEGKGPPKRVTSRPYYGAIGGGYSFTFTPNALGLSITVKEELTGEEFDLTDYDKW